MTDVDNLTSTNNFTCGKWNVTKEQIEFQQEHGWWVQYLASIIAALFGLILNVIGIVTLLDRRLKEVFFNQLLLCLTIFDILFLICGLNESFRAHVVGDDLCMIPLEEHQKYILLVLIPFRQIVMCCSIYITLVMAYERYYAIAKVLLNRDSKLGFPKNKRLFKVVTTVIMFSVVYNFPQFFAFTISQNAVKVLTKNETIYNTSLPQFIQQNITINCLDPTELRLSKEFILGYLNIANLIVTGIIPFLCLSFFNCSIYVMLQASSRDIKQTMKDLKIFGSKDESRRNDQRSEERRRAIVICVIVITFLCCHVLRVGMNLEEIMTMEDKAQTMQRAKNVGQKCQGEQFWLTITADISHLLLQMNASVHFFVYCFCSKKFKDILKEKLLQMTKLLFFYVQHLKE